VRFPGPTHPPSGRFNKPCGGASAHAIPLSDREVVNEQWPAEVLRLALLVREQMAYFEKLRELRVSAEEGIALVDVADVVPSAEDALPRAKHHRRREADLSRG
jgi:hypothetical protein